ncbi:uncharacterized protein LOC106883650 [Octopus bimaculoides]|uniref:uncharacterized protein LOC106883650 n=1 Tax=Octopus bimaculoides TaxID=37653 RepID=UPI00071CEEC5|nr:uncharacterized protein LOC106883650 [Octopus bimaculoides]|eukprot:XP_014790233.1 PREDICTED: uncharacterized protein LOC106883650 [Octopus bimaculoides]
MKHLSALQKPRKTVATNWHTTGVYSLERGTSVTCVNCMSANGFFVPPFLIFKRKRIKENLKTGTPRWNKIFSAEKGWMDKDTSRLWLEHFIKYVKSSKDAPVLLVLDVHISHTRNLRATEISTQHGVLMLPLPLHCSHRMQPLDLTYFKPFSAYFNQAANRFMRTHPGSSIQTGNITGLLAEALSQASVMGTALNSLPSYFLYKY